VTGGSARGWPGVSVFATIAANLTEPALRLPYHCAILLGLIVSWAGLRAEAAVTFGVDLKGHPVSRLAEASDRVVVLIFAASDCPIANRYIPVIDQLHTEFGSKGAHFWWVFPNPDDTAAIVLKHNHDFSIHEDSLLDTKQTLVRMAHARITPEAAVFVVRAGGLSEVYHGRIDDRYISLGQERPRPQRDDLEQAIAAALAGKAVQGPGGPAVGCSIEFLQP